MVGEKEEDTNEKTNERLKARLTEIVKNRDPRWDQLCNEQVELKGNGAKIRWGSASSIIKRLRETQQEAPEDFAALVAIVKPRGATSLPPKGSRKSIQVLIDLAMLNPDGSPDPKCAAVLDAAYEETREGVVLRDPVVYTREFIQNWERVIKNGEHEGEEIYRLLREEARRLRGKGDRPAR